MLSAVVLAGVLLPVVLPRRRIGVAEPRSPAPLTPPALQIGATLVALTSGSLLAHHAKGFGLGADHPVPQGYVSRLELPGHTAAERAARYSELLRLGGPASLTSPGAVAGLGPVSTVTTDCGRCSEGGLPLRWQVKPATHQVVSADTFEMLGIRVLQGRAITDQDAWEAPRVAVINRSLAARKFQDGQALGRHIKVVDDGEQWSTVVGVVDDPPAGGLVASLQPRYAVYLSVLQHPPVSAELMTPAIQSAVAGVTVRQQLAAEAAPLAWFADRLGEQGRAMLAIAVLGSLAVARLWVMLLLVELGVHRALGARRRTIVRFVLVRAAAVCFGGLVLGIWFGAAVWGILGGLVEGLPPWDPAAVLRFGAILLASTLLGALPPVRRAARATPASLIATP